MLLLTSPMGLRLLCLLFRDVYKRQDGEFLDIDKKDTSSVRVCDDYVDIDDEDFEEEF